MPAATVVEMSGQDELGAALSESDGRGGLGPDKADSTAWRVATWLGFAAAILAGFFVFELLQSADATECYHAAVGGAEASNQDPPALSLCEDEPWPTVAVNLAANAAAEEPGEGPTFQLPSELDARADIVVWHALLAALITTAAGVIVPSLRWLKRLGGGWPIVFIANVIVILTVLVVREIARWTGDIELGPIDGIGLSAVGTLVTVAMLLTVPVAAGPVAMAIWSLLRSRPPETDPDPVREDSGELEDLRQVGQALRWHAYALGSILTLGILATAGRWRTIENLPGAGSLPTSLILLYGAIFAVAVAAVYLPAHNLWLSRVDRVVVNDTGGDRFAPGVSRRADELRRQLGADVTATDRARSALSIVAPLLAAAVSSLFG